MSRIITIGREFGSGGRELARHLAEILGCAYYDREIIIEIAHRTEAYNTFSYSHRQNILGGNT